MSKLLFFKPPCNFLFIIYRHKFFCTNNSVKAAISLLVRRWKIRHSSLGCSLVWTLQVVYFLLKHSCLYNKGTHESRTRTIRPHIPFIFSSCLCYTIRSIPKLDLKKKAERNPHSLLSVIVECRSKRAQKWAAVQKRETPGMSSTHAPHVLTRQPTFGRDRIYIFIIQKIVTMPIYGKEALNICHPTWQISCHIRKWPYLEVHCRFSFIACLAAILKSEAVLAVFSANFNSLEENFHD